MAPLDATFGAGGTATLAVSAADPERLIELPCGEEADDHRVVLRHPVASTSASTSSQPRTGSSSPAVFSTYPTQGFAGNDHAFSLQILGDGDILATGSTGYSSWGDFAVMKIVP